MVSFALPPRLFPTAGRDFPQPAAFVSGWFPAGRDAVGNDATQKIYNLWETETADSLDLSSAALYDKDKYGQNTIRRRS